jgi:hypothetical protein
MLGFNFGFHLQTENFVQSNPGRRTKGREASIVQSSRLPQRPVPCAEPEFRLTANATSNTFVVNL